MSPSEADEKALAAALDPGELRQVAERIAREIDAAQAVPAQSRPRAVVFRVGEARLALPLTSVREVVMPRPLSRVPRAPEAVLGIMNLRGRVVAVVDLVLGLSGEQGRQARGPTPKVPGQALDGGRILLFERGRREIGLLVSEVEGIEALGASTPLVDAEALGASLDALMD